MKPQSDYNRNIYLDILDYTRQDKELESRYNALEKESEALNGLLVVVVIGIAVLIILFWILNKRWRVRNALYIDKLKRTLEICRKITASVPMMREIEDVTKAVVASVKRIFFRWWEPRTSVLWLKMEREERCRDKGFVQVLS